MAREITYNNFKTSLALFMPNITTNHAITYTNTTRDISKLSEISLAVIVYNNFEILLVVFMPNITANHAITFSYTPQPRGQA